MTDAELGTRILQAVDRLKRAKAELAAVFSEALEKKKTLEDAGKFALFLTCEGGRGLVRQDKREAVKPWPAVGELRDILQRCEDARVEVAALQKTVKEMSGLDRDLLS